MNKPLILASASPRRAALLKQIGFDFEIVPSHVPEPEPDTGESPADFCLRAARIKAADTAARYPGRTVLAADTIVVHRGDVLGKPGNRTAARVMLKRLSGDRHEVLTALILQSNGDRREYCERTGVFFRALTETEIEWYVSTEEGLDKAGGYGIQGKGSVLIYRIEGCFFNVVGLPLARLWTMLAEIAPEYLPTHTKNTDFPDM